MKKTCFLSGISLYFNITEYIIIRIINYIIMHRCIGVEWGRMHVTLNGEPLEEVECFKYLGTQVAADGGCGRDVVHRMNEGYRAWGWGELKSVLSNRRLGIKAKKCLYEGVIVLTALYGAEE